MTYMQELYKKEVVPKLMGELGISHQMAVPKLIKIVVNCGLGEALKDKKVVEKMAVQLAVLTGQKPAVTRAKQAISTFKLRAGDAIGLKVTLRGKRMYEFLIKLISIALPRVRDFSGIPLKGFDGKGSYTLGIREQTIFPEIDYDIIDHARGFEITLVTSATNRKHAESLLVALGLPFEKRQKGT